MISIYLFKDMWNNMTHQHHTTDLDTVRQALGGERRAPKQLSEALTGKPRIG